MKILAISDTHRKHLEIPKKYLENKDGSIDMIIHAGDISGRGYISEITSFLEWYDKLNFRYKILIPGNHDFYFEETSKEDIEKLLAKYPNITYLQDSGVEIEGVKLWGSGVTPFFHNWAFNRLGDAIQKHWDMIPLDTHILITHGPIKGYLDLTIRGDVTGCPYLLEHLPKLTELKVHIAGHIHEAYGRIRMADGQFLLNASVLNHNYEMQNRPIVFTLGQTEDIFCGYIEPDKK